MNSIIEEQKAELFNHKKEIIELKKTINKLNNERHIPNGANEVYNNEVLEENEYNNDEYPKKGKQIKSKKDSYNIDNEFDEYEDFKEKKIYS